ncbi:glycosyltransferase [Acidobacteria bacterium AH-259-A15]|nr:glycosyltransferase [Acidobacteria bacterium AH-259-A15]
MRNAGLAVLEFCRAMLSIKETVLSDEILLKVEEITRADIVVGIPSFNNSNTIKNVVRAVQYGLAKYFPRQKAVVINSDGGSTDGTRQIVEETGVYTEMDTILVQHQFKPAQKVVTPYMGLSGKGTAFQTIFEIAVRLRAKVCLVVDSDLRSITPEWIELLAGPVLLKDYDFVAPWYSRYKYDGTITNSIIYPATRALYGKRIRQPIGGDFGFSRRLAKQYLSRDIWGTDIARFGIDIWMSTKAVSEGYKICQAFLGAKIHDAKDPAKALGMMFQQVIGTLFKLMERYEDRWKDVRGSSPTALYGFRSEVYPKAINVSFDAMMEKFQKGYRDNKDFLKSCLPAERMEELEDIASQSIDGFEFPMRSWVRLVWDFAVAYHRSPKDQETIERLMLSIVPLYFGRTASFVKETYDMPTYEAEEIIEKLCDMFEEEKQYLVKRWFGG